MPPGGAHGEAAHAVAHAELEGAGEKALGRGADHQRLQDAETGMRLHDPLKTEDVRAGHQAVAVEGEEKLVPLAPAAGPVADIARLEPGVPVAPAIDRARAKERAEPGEGRLLRIGDLGIIRVGEDKDVELRPLPRRVDRGAGAREAVQRPLGSSLRRNIKSAVRP